MEKPRCGNLNYAASDLVLPTAVNTLTYLSMPSIQCLFPFIFHPNLNYMEQNRFRMGE